MKKKSKLQKVEQETVPVKYRIYPNLKQRKYLDRCFLSSRIVWNWLLGVQKDYDRGLTEWVREKYAKELEKFCKKEGFELKSPFEQEKIKELKKTEAKKFHLEVIRLKKEEVFPSVLGVELLKAIIPNAEEDEIKKMIVSKKDSSASNKTINIMDLKRQVKNLREDKPILNQVASQGIHHVPLNLAKAWKACYDKNRPDSGEPKFKNKFAKQSFTFDSAKLQGNKLFLPPKSKNIFIKTKVHREMEGEQKTITVTKTKTGEYYASVNFRQDVFFPKPKSFNKSNTVGIDLGIKDDYIIMSNDMGSIKNPKFFKKHERRIAILNRKLSRSQSNSNSRKKVLHELNREYEKLAKAREDFQHKVTHQIVTNPNVKAVAVEDLNVKGMTAKNKPKEGENGHYLPNNQCAKRGQNKATLDAGFGRVRQMLDYKCKRNGKAFGKVGRFFASSKMCNNCGHINKELKVSDQYWTCEKCGEHHERNFNAANNVRDEFIRESKKKKQTKASK